MLHTGVWLKLLKGKYQLKDMRHTWENHIEMDIKETGEGVDCIHLVQGCNMSYALVNKVMNFQVQKCMLFLGQGHTNFSVSYFVRLLSKYVYHSWLHTSTHDLCAHCTLQ
jgi:hypothetical protein